MRLFKIMLILLVSGLCIAGSTNDIAMPQTAIVSKYKTSGSENIDSGFSTMTVEGAQIIEIKGERIKLSDQKPDSWKTGTKLSQIQTLGSGKGITAIGSVDSNSIVVRFDGVLLSCGQDYLVDSNWGVLGIGPQSRVTTDDIVEVDYRYSLRRMDCMLLMAMVPMALSKA